MKNKNTKPIIFYVPDDYSEPSTSTHFLKLQKGETRVRIVSPMIMGWEDWIEIEGQPKPIRYHYHNKPADEGKNLKLFWSFVVWNYQLAKLQILHVTQAGIRKTLDKIVKDPEWGDPGYYDLKIIRNGDELKTVYTVLAVPPTPRLKKIDEALSKVSINLEALFENGDPFGGKL